MAYGILRFGKLKSAGAIKASQQHCDRSQETPNADPTRTPLNRQLIGSLEELPERIEALLQESAQRRKIRPDSNLACEILLTASTAWFRQDENPKGALDMVRVNQFAECSAAFLEKEFQGRILSAILHLDEVNPHIHAHFVPLHRDEEKAWLSWENWFGGREKLREWQDKFAEYLKPVELQRGIKRITAQHIQIQEIYEQFNSPLELPELEREFALPKPQNMESAEEYHRRVDALFSKKLPIAQDAISVVAAHARNEEFAVQREKDSRVTLHALTDEVDSLEWELSISRSSLVKLNQKQKEAIAQELITTANMVLNLAERNYWKGRQYVFSRRKGFTKIDDREGRRLVHNEGGFAILSTSFKLDELEKIRKARDQVLLILSQRIEQKENKKARK